MFFCVRSTQNVACVCSARVLLAEFSCSRQPFCELREVTCWKRKCTFSISRGEWRGGGRRAEWEDSWREPRVMQVGL